MLFFCSFWIRQPLKEKTEAQMDNLVRSIPTTFFSFQMAWQISLAAAIWAFSPRRPPTVARRINETQQRQPIASIWFWIALGWDWETRSRIWERKAEKFLSSHCPPNVETNTTYAWKRFEKKSYFRGKSSGKLLSAIPRI